jgi:hypothetical protein
MYSWVRYSVAAYVGLLLAGSLVMSGRRAAAEWSPPAEDESLVVPAVTHDLPPPTPAACEPSAPGAR